MSISIKNYIDIPSKALNPLVGPREYSGLVFTTEDMGDGAADYSDESTSYAAGKAVRMNYATILACFGESAKITEFASRYFSYAGPNGSPAALNVAKYTAGSEATAFATATEEFSNFGSFTFLGADADSIDPSDFPVENSAHIIAVDVDSETYPTNLKVAGVHAVLGHVEEDGVNYAAWMPMAWYASVNYDLENASGTIDYKRFGSETPTVNTDAAKTKADNAVMNYLGRVQVYGAELSFYQPGCNGDKIDLGVFRDATWIRSEVEIGWFNLAGAANKIPTNQAGVGMVYSMLVDVASRAVVNGAILVDKPITKTMERNILLYTNDAEAVNAIRTNGFYISAKIVESEGRFVCFYTIVYAKGDHIGKVEGQHILI